MQLQRNAVLFYFEVGKISSILTLRISIITFYQLSKYYIFQNLHLSFLVM